MTSPQYDPSQGGAFGEPQYPPAYPQSTPPATPPLCPAQSAAPAYPPPAYPQSPYGPGAYGQPPQPYGYQYPAPATAPTNTMAILSLVMAFVFAPLAIVFGHIARKQMRQTGESGDGLAMAGLILGYVFTAIAVLTVALIVIAAVSFGVHATGGTGRP
jgi:hypothetical protein